jgi:nicotinate-nucleotide adenylyltransferase
MNIAPSPHQSTLWSNRTVGLLGGSFNPAHEGHRHISLYALKLLGLDAVWWVVSPQNPLKSTTGMASFEKRMASAYEVSDHPDIYVTDIEQQMNTHYAIDTLAALKNHFPRTSFI